MTEVAAAWGDFALGQPIVDGWTTQDVLGRGGMSIVLEVSKEPLPPRAMKVLKPLGSDTAARFIQECAVTANLEHPNIVKVENFGVLADGSPYLLMERLHGCTLRSVLKEARRRQEASSRRQTSGVEARPPHPYLTAEVLLQIVRQLGRGLLCAHTATPVVVHRDIKPENVFLHHPRHTRAVEVKLLDFGIATVLEEDRLAGDADVAGSPPYMPPEVPARQPVTGASDIYSFAVLIYELLTLHSPWRERIRSPADVLRVHQQERPVPPSHWRAWITPIVDDLLVRALATEPSRRPPLSELLEGLGELLRVDDGSAKHRVDTDAVVTTDPGLNGLVRAATEGSMGAPRPPSVLMPARVAVVPSRAPLSVAEPAAMATGSARNVSMEEVVGTLDQPAASAARRGSRPRSVALGRLGAAVVLLTLAAGGWKVWSMKAAAHTAVASAEPVLVPAVVRPAPTPSWLADRPLTEPPPVAPAPSTTNASVHADPVPTPARPALHKAANASGSAPSRPKITIVDEALSHPPVIPSATIVDEFLLHPPVSPTGGDVPIHNAASRGSMSSSHVGEGRGVRAAPTAPQ